jgi:hypothetical protein
MTDSVGASDRIRLLLIAIFFSILAIVSSLQTFAAGGSAMSLTADEEAQIRKTVEAIDDEEPAGVLKGDPQAQARFWARDLTVNGPGNRVVHHDQILGLMKQHTGLQYLSFERHREATVVRRDSVVTMGYEIVVPKGNVPDSGKTINRRYTNILLLREWGLAHHRAPGNQRLREVAEPGIARDVGPPPFARSSSATSTPKSSSIASVRAGGKRLLHWPHFVFQLEIS